MPARLPRQPPAHSCKLVIRTAIAPVDITRRTLHPLLLQSSLHRVALHRRTFPTKWCHSSTHHWNERMCHSWWTREHTCSKMNSQTYSNHGSNQKYLFPTISTAKWIPCFLIRCRSYYFFTVHFCVANCLRVATTRGRCLFLWKACRHQQRL